MKTFWTELTFSDKILILFLSLAALAMLFLKPSSSAAAVVEVYKNNHLLATYSLQKDQIITIDSGCQAEIKDGRIRMLTASCKNKLCVRQGWSAQEPIICLPNKIALVIRSGETKREVHILR